MNRSERINDRINKIIDEEIKVVKELANYVTPSASKDDNQARSISNSLFSLLNDYLSFSRDYVKKNIKEAKKDKIDILGILNKINVAYSKRKIYTKTKFRKDNALWFEAFNQAAKQIGNPIIKETDMLRELKRAIDFVFDTPTFNNNAQRQGIKLPKDFGK